MRRAFLGNRGPHWRTDTMQRRLQINPFSRAGISPARFWATRRVLSGSRTMHSPPTELWSRNETESARGILVARQPGVGPRNGDRMRLTYRDGCTAEGVWCDGTVLRGDGIVHSHT